MLQIYWPKSWRVSLHVTIKVVTFESCSSRRLVKKCGKCCRYLRKRLIFLGETKQPRRVSAHFCCPKSPLAHLDDQIICRIKVIHLKCSSRPACTAERFTCRPTQHNKVALETTFIVLIVDKMNYTIVDLL